MREREEIDDEETDADRFADDVRWLALSRVIARDVLDDHSRDDYGDAESLRESLVRQRLAAAAERQAHDARGCVFDWTCDPVTGAGNIIVATSTGDRREERELLLDAVTAVEAIRASATRDLQHAMIIAFLLPWLLESQDTAQDTSHRVDR